MVENCIVYSKHLSLYAESKKVKDMWITGLFYKVKK